MTQACDIAIVGAGPVGLYASYCAGFRGLTSVLLDALPEVGGQVSAMYPEKLIFDVAGFEAVRGRDLIASLAAQAMRYSPKCLLGQTVLKLERRGEDRFILTTSNHDTVEAKAIVVTAGIGSFNPRPLPAATEYRDRGLVHFVPRLQDATELDVVIVGGGDSALDWALALEPIARSVTVVHRRARFRAHAASVSRLAASGVRVITDAEVTQAIGSTNIEAVVVTQADLDVPDQRLNCQLLVAALGFVADLGPIEAWGLKVVDRRISVDSTMATTVNGIFAAGDIADYVGKPRLMSVGFGEAAIAVGNAAVLIDPDQDLFPGHSSDQ